MSDAPPPDGSPAPGAPGTPPTDEPPPPEEKTAPHRLRELADKAAKKRRRTTAAELLVRRPKSPEVRVPLDRTETVIGRDARCDIVLNEEKASRRHARIQRGEGGYFEIVDLGSRNGIVVDEERVERMTLLDGDRFVIGETEFTIIVGPMPGVEG